MRNRIVQFLKALGDRTNPVVTKELRQAVRSRLIIVLLLLFLLVSTLILGGYVLSRGDIDSSPNAGSDIFHTLLIVLTITCCGVIPLYTSVRLGMERNDSNVDLLFITTITPGAIVRGKFWAAMATTMLIYSCCMPFLCLTYLLRGIDLPTIFAALVLQWFVTAFMVLCGILVGAFGGGRLLRIFTHLLLLGAIIWAISISTAAAFAMVRFGVDWSDMGSSKLAMLGTAALAGFCGMAFMYVLAVAQLSAPSSNRMLPVRICIFAIWLVLGIVLTIWSAYENEIEFVDVWMGCTVSLMCLGLLFAIGEREHWSPRVTRAIPRSWPARVLAWLFYSGSSGGVAYCCFIAFSTLAWSWCWVHCHRPDLGYYGYHHYDSFYSAAEMMLGVFMYTLCYCMAAVLIRRWLFKEVQLFFLPLIAVMVGAGATILPLLLSYFVNSDHWRMRDVSVVYFLFSPAALSDEWKSERSAVWVFLVSWSIIMCLLGIPWLAQQWDKFRRPEAQLAEAIIIDPPAPTA